MWLLPSLGRPHRLMDFARSYMESGEDSPVLVILAKWDKKLEEYGRIPWPPTFKFVETDVRYCGPSFNWGFQQFPKEPFYGMLNDDMELRGEKVLKQLSREAKQRNVAVPRDSNFHDFYTSLCIGGDLVRSVGFIMPEGLLHNCGEGMWLALAQTFGVLKIRRDLLIEHKHFFFKKAPFDSTYAHGIKGSENSQETYRKFMETNFGALVEKVRPLYG